MASISGAVAVGSAWSALLGVLVVPYWFFRWFVRYVLLSPADNAHGWVSRRNSIWFGVYEVMGSGRPVRQEGYPHPDH